MGFSHALKDGKTVLKAGASFTAHGSGGSASVGWQF